MENKDNINTDNINSITKLIGTDINNYIINDHNIPSNLETSKKLKKIIFNVIINRSYLDQETNQKIVPHVIEPSFGIDRLVLAILSDTSTSCSVNGCC